MTNVVLRLAEWETIAPTSGSPTEGISLGDDPSARDMARRLAKARMLVVQELRTGLLVRSTSFVGRVRLGVVEITVVPKLRSESLMTLLRYAYGLRNLHLMPFASQTTQALGFQDILIRQLVEEARELLARGLRRAYVRGSEPCHPPEAGSTSSRWPVGALSSIRACRASTTDETRIA
jgi:5-methylcytosine-specific restriction enzyme subunit McrC